MLQKIKTKIRDSRLERANILSAPSAFDNVLIGWIAPEVVRHQRGAAWKTIAILIFLMGTISAFLYDSWTFGMAIFACGAVYYIEHLEHPKDVEIKISDIGVKMGSKKYAYSKIKSFWIIYDPPYVATLNMRVMGHYPGIVTIQLHGQDPAELREFLISRIPELPGQNEALSDIFIRIFKI